MPKLYFNFIFFFALGFFLALAVTYPLILFLKKIKSEQVVRDEGPKSHQKKSGTPTMGGIGFIAAIVIVSYFAFPGRFQPLLILLIGYAAIGFIDDFLKVKRKHNQGLTFWQKINSQIIVALLFFAFIIGPDHLFHSPKILKMLYLDNFFLYLGLMLFMIIGGANASNLSDGLDGLLAGAAAISFFCFGVVLTGQFYPEYARFSFIFCGALLAFLVYNFPRKGGALVFMGDVGSLPVGAVLAGLAVISHNELLLGAIAGLFIIEALSVIIQVGGFKLFKRRIFKMSPLHHHFELIGWPEKRVVFFFWLVSLAFGLLGILLG